MAFTPSYRLLATALVAFGTSFVACDSELDTTCSDGECGGGLAPSAFECTTPRGFPTEVCAVLEKRCHHCHAGDGPGPFPILHYCDAQAVYFEDRLIWEQMKTVLNKSESDPPPKMPLDAFPLPPDELQIMNDWFEACEAGECPRGAGPECSEGGGGAGGGTGGAGGAGGG